MKNHTCFVRSLAALLAVSLCTLVSPLQAAAKKAFKVTGLYLEGCTCGVPCPCEISGLAHGCQGVGVLVLDSGSFAGKNLGGAKIAYAVVPGKWVRVYIDAKVPEVRQAAEAFGRTAFSAYGKIESVENATITVNGSGGKYVLAVNGGKTIKLTTTPILGGDKKTAVAIHNTNNPISPVFRQARSVRATFAGGGTTFSFKDTNSYFNDRMNSSGAL